MGRVATVKMMVQIFSGRTKSSLFPSKHRVAVRTCRGGPGPGSCTALVWVCLEEHRCQGGRGLLGQLSLGWVGLWALASPSRPFPLLSSMGTSWVLGLLVLDIGVGAGPLGVDVWGGPVFLGGPSAGWRCGSRAHGVLGPGWVAGASMVWGAFLCCPLGSWLSFDELPGFSLPCSMAAAGCLGPGVLPVCS